MTAREPQVGDRYDSPGGSYEVHHVGAVAVTLRDRAHRTTFVAPSRARLAAEYTFVAAEPAAPAWVEPLETCSECDRRVRVTFQTDDPKGPKYCCRCASTDGASRRAPSAPSVRIAGVDEDNQVRADIGSYARPVDAPPRPAPAPPTPAETRDLWTETTKSVAR